MAQRSSQCQRRSGHAIDSVQGRSAWAVLLASCLLSCAASGTDDAEEMTQDPTTEGMRRGDGGSGNDGTNPDEVADPSPSASGKPGVLEPEANTYDVPSDGSEAEASESGVVSTSVTFDPTATPATECRIWLDEAPSDMKPEDVAVTFFEDPEAISSGNGTPVPFTEFASCEPLPPPAIAMLDAGSSIAVADAGAPQFEGDAGRETPDAGTPADGGTALQPSAMALEMQPPTGASGTEGFDPASVTLDVEGWYFMEAEASLWLELCPRVCARMQTLGGILAVDITIGVRAPAAR